MSLHACISSEMQSSVSFSLYLGFGYIIKNLRPLESIYCLNPKTYAFKEPVRDRYHLV
jgi:hypothetical protein